MAGISADGGGHGGKKSLDSEIPLVPFIDLLLCCVMFLLATAVWNQLARINANQKVPGKPQEEMEMPPQDEVKLYVEVTKSGYTISSTAGDRADIQKTGDNYDTVELAKALDTRRQLEPERTKITVAPEDGVAYSDVVTAMDMVVGKGFVDMSLGDAARI